MKITESRLKEIIKEEVDSVLNEEGYAGKIINFLKSLSPPKDERPKRKEPEEEEEEEEPVSPVGLDYGHEVSYLPPAQISPEDLVIKPPPKAPTPVYKISDVFASELAKPLYSSWKSKRKNKSKEKEIFIRDLNIFVNFVAPYLPSHYIEEGFKIEKMFDRGEFVARKDEMEKAWKNVSPENKQAINRIYTATQARKGQENKILFHILHNIKKQD
jgi:hypothetical protein